MPVYYTTCPAPVPVVKGTVFNKILTPMRRFCTNKVEILIETAKRRILVADTDIGRELKESIGHLEKLLNAYRDGILIEKGI